MVNILKVAYPCFLLLLVLFLWASYVQAGPQYKKKTVIDFDEALIEGKSRKPHSAFLSEKENSALTGLSAWGLDFDKRISESKSEVKNGL